MSKPKKISIKAKVVILLVATYLLAVLGPPVYKLLSHNAGPWEGRIVDIETKGPLEGAVVLAVWEISHRSPGGGVDRFHRAYEAITDKNGNFEIPRYVTIIPLPIMHLAQEPYFVIFKPGYLSIPRIGGTFLLPSSSRKSTERQFKLNENVYTFNFAEGLIELPKLLTKEDRREVITFHIPPIIPDKFMSDLIKLMNSEQLYLGLQLTHTRKAVN